GLRERIFSGVGANPSGQGRATFPASVCEWFPAGQETRSENRGRISAVCRRRNPLGEKEGRLQEVNRSRLRERTACDTGRKPFSFCLISYKSSLPFFPT